MKKKRVEKPKLKCNDCKEEKEMQRHFYSTYSALYEDEKIPICKDCLLERYKILEGLYKGNELLALRHFCMNFDIYYDEELAKPLRGGSEPLMVVYMRRMGSNHRKYKGKTSLDSLFEIKILDELGAEDEFPITYSIRIKWGKGYTDDEYRILERAYKEYDEFYAPRELTTKKLFKELCVIELEGQKARINGDMATFEKMSKLVSSKMQDADVKPNQKKKVGETAGETFGTKMQIYERKKPILVKLEEYEDIDGIGKYITKYLIKPLAKFLGFATGEYTIEDGDTAIELSKEFEEELEKAGDVNED